MLWKVVASFMKRCIAVQNANPSSGQLPPTRIARERRDSVYYREKSYAKKGEIVISEVSFQLRTPDWLLLQNSPEWSALEAKVGDLQKEYIHLMPLVKEFVGGSATSTRTVKQKENRLLSLLHRIRKSGL